MSTVLFTVGLSGGQELRVETDGAVCELFVRSVYGEAGMTAGVVRFRRADLRLVLHALKYTLWDLERQQAAPPGQPDRCAA